MVVLKVWHDWDSGAYETVSDHPPSHGRRIVSEMSEEDFRDYEAVLKRYREWQDRLEKMRKGK
jgi:hypothetical protein